MPPERCLTESRASATSPYHCQVTPLAMATVRLWVFGVVDRDGRAWDEAVWLLRSAGVLDALGETPVELGSS